MFQFSIISILAKPECVQDVVHSIIQESITKQAEPIYADSEISDTVVPKAEIKKEEKETAEKSDTEKSVKDENKLEARSEDGRQSIRVIHLDNKKTEF